MTTITRAWEAFQAAVAEALALHASKGSVAEIHDLLRHARELLDIIEEEIALESSTDLPASVRGGISDLRGQLAAVERVLVTRH